MERTLQIRARLKLLDRVVSAVELDVCSPADILPCTIRLRCIQNPTSKNATHGIDTARCQQRARSKLPGAYRSLVTGKRRLASMPSAGQPRKTGRRREVGQDA
jgi:hypothetical protein